MSRQPTETVSRSAAGETVTQRRFRMIRETEAFLNERLDRRNGDWATDETLDGRWNPLDHRHDRRQSQPRAEQNIDSRMRPQWGTLVDVLPNQSGIVDDPRLNALELQLAELTDDRAAGDIVVGVEQVAVMTAGLMSLLAMIRPRLECQNRKLTVHGLRPECAGVLCGSGLEHLIEPANRQATVVPGAPRLFQPALSARSRGSERAA